MACEYADLLVWAGKRRVQRAIYASAGGRGTEQDMSETSNQMVSLLHELSVLKELEKAAESVPDEPCYQAEHESRSMRIKEITAEIHRVAAIKKANEALSPNA
jgi:hypothetical protein